MKRKGNWKIWKHFGWCAMVLACAVLLGACGGTEKADTSAGQTAAEDGGEQAGTEPPVSRETEEAGRTPEQTDMASSDTASSDTASADQASAAEETELKGIIEKLGDHSMEISEMIIEDAGGALGEVGVVNVGPGEMIEVKYTEDTVFSIRSSSDMGETYSDAAATAADLETGRSFVALGQRDGAVFVAKEIMIYHFD